MKARKEEQERQERQEREELAFFEAILTVIRWLLVAVAIMAILYGWMPTVFGAEAETETETEEETHAILICALLHGGMPSAASEAGCGERVGVTVRADAGYRVSADSVRAIGADGTVYPCEAEEADEGRFSFVMPAQSVTLYAEFVPITYTLYFYIHAAVPYLPPEEWDSYLGVLYTRLTYTVETAQEIELPTCPAPDGYIAEWNWDAQQMSERPANYAITASYREKSMRIRYTVRYLLAGQMREKTVEGEAFSVGMLYGAESGVYTHPTVNIPGYKTADLASAFGPTDFGSLCAAAQNGITVTLPTDAAFSYTVSYYEEGGEEPYFCGTYTVADAHAFVPPDLPARDGESGEWLDHPLNHPEGGDIRIYPRYSALPTVSIDTKDTASTETENSRAIAVFCCAMGGILTSAIGFWLCIARHRRQSRTHGATVLARDACDIGNGAKDTITETKDTRDAKRAAGTVYAGIRAAEADCRMSDREAAAAVLCVGKCRIGRMAAVNLGTISRHFADGETVNLRSLRERGLVGEDVCRCKILAGGVLARRNLAVEADAISLQAVKMILLCGGSVVRLGGK